MVTKSGVLSSGTRGVLLSEYSLIINLTPEPHQQAVSTSESSVLIQDSNSNWQRVTCEVKIEIEGYIDFFIAEKKLFFEFEGSDPLGPKIFNFLFEILSNISWKLRKSSKTQLSNWLVSPNDIEQVTYDLQCDGSSFQWIHLPVKSGYKIQHIGNDLDSLTISLSEDLEWHEKCLIRGEDWLSAGETQLSIFWLNIGIESFFETLFKKCASLKNFEDEELFSETYYDRTKRELEKINSAEILDTIKWPKPEKIHLSMFKKIKVLFDNGLLNFDLKTEAMKKYNDISKYRNVIFHGITEDVIDVEFVKKALESYKWLVSNCEILEQ